MARSPKREIKKLLANLLDRGLAIAVSFEIDHENSQIHDRYSNDVAEVVDDYTNSCTLLAIVFDSGKSAVLTMEYDWEDLDKPHLAFVTSVLKNYSRE